MKGAATSSPSALLWRMGAALSSGLLGVRPELLPRTMTEAGQLTDLISRRQLAPSDEGREMLAALLGMLRQNSPPFLKGFPAALMRRFLPSGIADGLQVPNLTLERLMASGFALLASGFDRIIAGSRQREFAFRCFSSHLIQWMINVDLGGSRAKFNIPGHLHEDWGIAPGGQERSFWQRLVDRYFCDRYF